MVNCERVLLYGLDIVGLDVDGGTAVPVPVPVPVADVVVPNVMHVLGGLIRTAEAPPTAFSLLLL